MDHEPRALDNPVNWSFGVGRLLGIRIRLHLLFILGGLIVLAHGAATAPEGSGWLALTHAAGMVLVLFSIVLLHELGHCIAARRCGGEADEILMWPLGGLASLSLPHEPGAHIRTTLAGPLVNVLICVVAATVLAFWTGRLDTVPWNPFDPFAGGTPVATEYQWWVVVVFGFSYLLLLFNLIPMFPLDGGRLLQCVLWTRTGYRHATSIATGVGMVGAIALGLLAALTRNVTLLAIAFMGYLTCFQQRQAVRMGVFGPDDPGAYEFAGGVGMTTRSTSPRRPGFLARRRAARAARRELREQQRLADQQRRVDAVLEKISRLGANSLTPDERRTLEYETQRQRSARQE